MIRSEITPRLISGITGLSILIAVIWFGPKEFLLGLALLVCIVAAREYCKLAFAASLHPASTLVALWSGSLVYNGIGNGEYALAIIAVGLLLSLCWFLLRGSGDTILADWASTVAGAIYVGLPISFALLIFAQIQGREWLLLGLLTTFATDTAAYFIGHFVGRHQMAPRISPGKSWEGASAGLVSGVVGCLALASLLNLPITLFVAGFIGMVISVAAQIGDLAESLLKRAAGAKQSGSLIPGHGGLLDRLDSISFVLVVLYYLAGWLVEW